MYESPLLSTQRTCWRAWVLRDRGPVRGVTYALVKGQDLGPLDEPVIPV